MDVSQCQLLGKKASEGKAAKAARILFRSPAAPAQGKGLGLDWGRGAFGSCGKVCSSPRREGGQDNCIQRTIEVSTAEPSGIN